MVLLNSKQEEGYAGGRKLSSYLSEPGMIVYLQKNGEIGYGFESQCPWEPEHQCLILRLKAV